jgi:hypothetical protein
MKKSKGPEEDGATSTISSSGSFTATQVNLSWEHFENVGTLGTGAFGDVFKVKCKLSS